MLKNGNNVKNKISRSIFKAIMFSLPSSIFIGLTASGGAMAKYKMIYGVWPDDSGIGIICIVVVFLAVVFLSMPIAIALHKDLKDKGWIIAMSLLSFLPFGIIMYLISLVWSVLAEKKDKTEQHNGKKKREDRKASLKIQTKKSFWVFKKITNNDQSIQLQNKRKAEKNRKNYNTVKVVLCAIVVVSAVIVVGQYWGIWLIKSKAEILQEVRHEIVKIQELIDKSTQNEIDADIVYKDCVSKNNKLRAIADKHQKLYPENMYKEWSTKEDCKTIADMVKTNEYKSFLDAFFYKEIGMCEINFDIDGAYSSPFFGTYTFYYLPQVSKYCDERYRGKNRGICKSVFYEKVTIKKPIDDLARKIFSDDMRGNFTFLELLGLDVYSQWGETVARINTVHRNCLKRNGRKDESPIGEMYDVCQQSYVREKSCKSYSNWRNRKLRY